MKVSSVMILGLGLILGLAAAAVGSGPQIETRTFAQGEVFIIPGIGALVVFDGDRLKVDMVIPAEQRPEAYREVDIQQGDQLLMMNGSKVTSIDDLETRFEAIEIGKEVKFGLRRDDGMHIAKLVKADQKDMAGGQMMVIQAGGDGDMDSAVAGGANVLRVGSGDDGTAILVSAGLVLKDGEKGPEVLMVLPNAAELLGGEVPEVGDVVIELQGEKVTSAKQCMELMDKIDLGTAVKLTYDHAGETRQITFDKKQAPGAMIRRQAK